MINSYMKTFDSQSKMSDLISEHYDLLLVITRFGIPLGVEDKTIAEVCEENNVDTATLMTVLNAVANIPHYPSKEELKGVSVESLLVYLSNAHTYFLKFRLPFIREQLVAAMKDDCPAEVAYVIQKFFDDYVAEVHKHMNYEEKVVFPYAKELISGKELSKKYSIAIFRKRHDQVEAKITELKNILIKYYPAKGGYALTAVLHDIFESEADLSQHNYVEDHIFIPLMEALEKTMNK